MKDFSTFTTTIIVLLIMGRDILKTNLRIE